MQHGSPVYSAFRSFYGSAPLLAQSGLGRLRPATWGPSLTVIPLHDDRRALPPGTGRLARCREFLARHGVESRVALSFGAEQLPIGLRTVIGHRLA